MVGDTDHELLERADVRQANLFQTMLRNNGFPAPEDEPFQRPDKLEANLVALADRIDAMVLAECNRDAASV